MLIVGAGGHAKEILDILLEGKYDKDILFFDDVNAARKTVFNTYEVVKTIEGIQYEASCFTLGIGGTNNREKLFNIFSQEGLLPKSVISTKASIGRYEVALGECLNIMNAVTISSEVKIGKGSLINRGVNIHHEVEIGEFCELSPGAQILGRVIIGNRCSFGAGAIVLPDIVIEDNVTVGAGAVVTKSVSSGMTVIGVPARKL